MAKKNSMTSRVLNNKLTAKDLKVICQVLKEITAEYLVKQNGARV